MKNKFLTVLIFALSDIFLFSSLSQAGEAEENAALASARQWLQLIDNGEYGKSWDEAAEIFRNVVPKEQWLGSMNAFRTPLGKLISRSLKSKKYETSMPGVPDGKYVIIQFESSFQNKKSTIETVTPKLCKDGKWRVSGYYIR